MFYPAVAPSIVVSSIQGRVYVLANRRCRLLLNTTNKHHANHRAVLLFAATGMALESSACSACSTCLAYRVLEPRQHEYKFTGHIGLSKESGIGSFGGMCGCRIASIYHGIFALAGCWVATEGWEDQEGLKMSYLAFRSVNYCVFNELFTPTSNHSKVWLALFHSLCFRLDGLILLPYKAASCGIIPPSHRVPCALRAALLPL